MKKFQFRLDPLIVIRKRKEDEEIRNLSVIVSEVNKLNSEKNSLEQEIQSISENISKNIKKGISIQDYYEYSDINRTLGLKINSIEQEINAKKPDLDMARMRVDLARKEKKILEILRENSLSEYKKKLRKVEKVELEEYLTTLEFNKNSEFNDEDSHDLSNKKSGRIFKIISKEDNLNENLPEEYKNLKAIYDKFSKI
ncbi:MAG: flagellar export protein FliJ [Leptospiraceae bacterium]|jgi:flagellar FliJ protein|nr:flagellar export protein FliJ [Leptospiraceae bacterium]PJE04602.1 MAG: flagellar export protein FliJ [Leptospira sp.]